MRKTDFESRHAAGGHGLPRYAGFGQPRLHTANTSATRESPSRPTTPPTTPLRYVSPAVDLLHNVALQHNFPKEDAARLQDRPESRFRSQAVPLPLNVNSSPLHTASPLHDLARSQDIPAELQKAPWRTEQGPSAPTQGLKGEQQMLPSGPWTFPAGSKYTGQTLVGVAKRAPRYFKHIHSKLSKEPRKILKFPGLERALAAFRDEFREEFRIIEGQFDFTHSSTATAYSDMAKHVYLLQMLIEHWTREHKDEMSRSEEKYMETAEKTSEEVARAAKDQLEYAKWLRRDILAVETRIHNAIAEVSNKVDRATADVERVNTTVEGVGSRIEMAIQETKRVETAVNMATKEVTTKVDLAMKEASDKVGSAIEDFSIMTEQWKQTLNTQGDETVKKLEGKMDGLGQTVEDKFAVLQETIQRINNPDTHTSTESNLPQMPNVTPLDPEIFSRLISLPTDIKAGLAGWQELKTALKHHIEEQHRLPDTGTDTEREKTAMQSRIEDLESQIQALQLELKDRQTLDESRSQEAQSDEKRARLPEIDEAIEARDVALRNREIWKQRFEKCMESRNRLAEHYTLISASLSTDWNANLDQRAYQAAFGIPAIEVENPQRIEEDSSSEEV